MCNLLLTYLKRFLATQELKSTYANNLKKRIYDTLGLGPLYAFLKGLKT